MKEESYMLHAGISGLRQLYNFGCIWWGGNLVRHASIFHNGTVSWVDEF